MTAITRPTYMQLQDWADQMCSDMAPYGVVNRLQDESKWQDWGAQFLNNTSIGRNLPSPYGFDDWNEWAERLCGSLA
jgi:hypothetical protein